MTDSQTPTDPLEILWKTYKNGKLDVEELRSALRGAQIAIGDDDAQMLREYFKAKTRSDQIKKSEFIALMTTEF